MDTYLLVLATPNTIIAKLCLKGLGENKNFRIKGSKQKYTSFCLLLCEEMKQNVLKKLDWEQGLFSQPKGNPIKSYT